MHEHVALLLPEIRMFSVRSWYRSSSDPLCHPNVSRSLNPRSPSRIGRSVTSTGRVSLCPSLRHVRFDRNRRAETGWEHVNHAPRTRTSHSRSDWDSCRQYSSCTSRQFHRTLSRTDHWYRSDLWSRDLFLVQSSVQSNRSDRDCDSWAKMYSLTPMRERTTGWESWEHVERTDPCL